MTSSTPASTSPRLAAAPPPAGPPRALVLGALVPWKRADLALEIAARMPELRLELAGAPMPGDDPAYAAGCAPRAAPDLAAASRFPARSPTRAPRSRGAHLLLHCADAEPFGMALLEALASGRPVVGARRRRPAGDRRRRAARLYPPGDAAAGARRRADVLADPARRPPRGRAERVPRRGVGGPLRRRVEAVA